MDISLIRRLATDVKKLGAISTISYVGALLCIIAVIFNDFSTSKGWALLISGIALLVTAAVFYLMQQRAENRKEALGVLREVHNRLAEQTANGTNEQTVSITMTIAELPKQITEILKKL